MIKINLLPVEKRKPERTPLPRFGLILADVGVGAVAVAVILFWLILVGQKQGERDTKKSELAALKPDIERYKVAFAKNGELNAKYEEIKSIAGSGHEWWKILDALWEVINDNPGVWIDDITTQDTASASGMLQGADPGTNAPAPPYAVSISCHSAGLSTKAMTKFRTDLRKHGELKKYFQGINFSVEWTVEDRAEYVERYSLGFKVTLFGAQPAGGQP